MQLHAAPDDADIFDEEVWKACNFALGKFLSLEQFRKDAEQARRIPSTRSAFRNFQAESEGLVEQSVDPQRRVDGVRDREPRNLRLVRSAEGQEVLGWAHLSSTTDMTAFVLVFEHMAQFGCCPVLAWHWMPAGKVEELAHSDHKIYPVWVEQGFIETTPGRTIDKKAVANKLAELKALFDVQMIGYDPWRFEDLEKILTEEGIELPFQMVSPNLKGQTPCVDALEFAVLDRKIGHFNPVLTMCVGNAKVYADGNGNRKLDKKASRARIDGAQALAIALGVQSGKVLEETGKAFIAEDVAGMLSDDVELLFKAA